jgi:histidinol-phosphate phosphatase family protein
LDKAPAIFVDRDDTLMLDVKYCDNPDRVQLMPGAAEGIKSLRNAGYKIVVITNQSGIGRGYFSLETLHKVNERLRSDLRKAGADYDALYYCPHTPEDGCDCRKPKPGLFLKAAQELAIDLASSFAIGDRDLDIKAGHAAGTKTVLVLNGHSRESVHSLGEPDLVASDLLQAAGLIRSQTRIRDGTVARRNPPHS